MISINIDLEPGFRKADANNLPSITNETVFDFITKMAKKYPLAPKAQKPDVDLRVDFVQICKTGGFTEARCLVFPAAVISDDVHVQVAIKVDSKKGEIIESCCEKCQTKETCPHILSFIFWLNNQTTQATSPIVQNFWGSEMENVIDMQRSEPLRICDIFASDDIRHESDLEVPISEEEGQAFLDAVLDEMENLGLRDSSFYQHMRTTVEEYEPIFIHHTMLNSVNNGVRDPTTFAQYMEDQSKTRIFENLSEVLKNSYKSHLWLEAQYMRLRCSLIHRITHRKDVQDDESILEALFCKDRENRVDDRQALKQHKRFILKQTEKLENKTYIECGLLFNDCYPYICASPDGITDDHIVEIKAPKTDEEFEKYLEGRETIAPKYMAQIQIQMYMANVTKALYCVLSPTFDINGALHYVWVQADMEFVASLLSSAEDFWRDVVFPRLEKVYLGN